MQTIPLAAVPNQTLLVPIGAVAPLQCQFTVYQKLVGMFLNLAVEGTNVLSGALCRNLSPLIINSYLGFPGELMFVDILGLNADPLYTGLGSRWFLTYVSPDDVVAFNLKPIFA